MLAFEFAVQGCLTVAVQPNGGYYICFVFTTPYNPASNLMLPNSNYPYQVYQIDAS